MSLQQLKQLFEQKEYMVVIEQAVVLINRDDVRNKAAYLFLAQAQIEVNMFQEAQNALNALYSKLQLGKEKQDDMLYIQALNTNQKLAVKMQSDQVVNKQMRIAGREQQRSNQFKIIEFYDFKEKYDKMLAEMEIFFTILIEDNNFKEIENNLVWLINHKGLSNEQKVDYACRIQEIDQFYKPYTNIEKTFDIVYNLHGMKPPFPPQIVSVAERLLSFLERQNWRKDLYSALNQLSSNKGAIDELQRYQKSSVPAAEIIFSSNPNQVLFGGDPSAIVHFIRAVCAKTYTLQHNSQEWKNFVVRLANVTKIELFQATIGDLQSNPTQLIIYCILDLNTILETAQVPDSDSSEQLFFVKHFARREDGLETLKNFSKEYKGLTPFVNLYLTLCITSLGWCGTKVPADEVLTLLNMATFLQRSIHKNKLGARNQLADMQVLACILNLRVAQHLSEEKRLEQIEQSRKTMEAIQKFAGEQIRITYLNEQAQSQWKIHLQEGKWQDAIFELDRLAEAQPSKASWVSTRTGWIQYSFLDRIASNSEEKALLLQNIYNKLQEAQASCEKDAEVLLMQGTILFLNGADLGAAGADPKACLTKWLLALKRDQTNADTFYCLALYYLCREKNLSKAQKCLDKALLLRPDFEEAFLLNFCLLSQEGRTEAAFELIGKMQGANRNVASTYYLGGLAQLQKGNYIQAIDDLQNATRFYSIAKQNTQASRNSLRQIYPLPQETTKEHAFSLLQAKLGLFGSHQKQFVAVWVHLIQCFVRIDKPQVALKCFARAMEEIESILGVHPSDLADLASDKETESFIGNLIFQVQKVKEAGRLQNIETSDTASETVFKTLKKINQILDTSENQVPSILVECIECLSMGSRITSDQNLSIELALTSLKICQKISLKNATNIVETQIALLIQKFTNKIEEGSLICFGNVIVPIWVSRQLELLEQMISVCDHRLTESQVVQQACIHALYAMSNKTADLEKKKSLLTDAFRRLESLIAKLDIRPDSQTVHGPFARSLLLDAAKIALQSELIGIIDDSLAQKKFKYVRWALMLDPENPELWVHLHLCCTADTIEDKTLRAKAIFKAYKLSPEMPFVQENLLKHYLSSPKTHSRAFHMILRVSQQLQAEQLQSQQQVTLPIVTAVLAFLNARAYFGTSSLKQRRTERKTQLLEAISLINLLDKRDDLIQMFQSLQVFLQHQKGDYLQTIKVLDHLCQEKGDDLLELMLIESYLGVSKVHDMHSVKVQFEQKTSSMHASKFSSLVSEAKSLLYITQEADVKNRVEALIAIFWEKPREIVSELILLQEICLNQGVLPNLNALDLAEDIMETIEQLELQDQRMLIIQSLCFCQLRDGEISSNSQIKDGKTGEFVEDINPSVKDYLKFLIKASRIKPKIIDSISTHKDLLHAKLLSLKHPYMFSGELTKQPDNPKDRVYIGFGQLIKHKQQQLLFAQKELMMNPSQFQANLKFIWGLIYNSRMADAAKAYLILNRKIEKSLVNSPSQQEQEAMKVLEHVLSKNTEASADLNLIGLCTEVKINKQSENPEEFNSQMLDRIATGVVKTITSTSRPKKQPQLVTELFFLLQSLLLHRGQYAIFIKFVERMLTVAASLPQTQELTELVNLLWCYKCLNKTSVLLEMKKYATATQEANLAVKVLRNGMIVRETIPALLLQARSYQVVRNEMQAASALDQTSDDPSVTRDIVMALGLFAQQAYKQFYLVTMGLVAGSKTQVEKMKETVFGEAKQQVYYTLAYAYYLKAFAECTFLAARRQGITLAEDFVMEEDGAVFDEAYFKRKADSSLSKASKACWHAGDYTGELKKAIDFMLTTQLN